MFSPTLSCLTGRVHATLVRKHARVLGAKMMQMTFNVYEMFCY